MDNKQQRLEQLIQQELSKLPERPAPETLIPRVLAQIQARTHKRWWQRAWIHWPRSAQLASLPLMLASACGTAYGLSMLCKLVLAQLGMISMAQTMDSVIATWDLINVLGNAAMLLGRSAGQTWLVLVLFVPLIMYLACVALGTLCYRMALHTRPSNHE